MNDYINSLKGDENSAKRVIERKIFLERIDGNEKALKMLSLDRLKVLEEYYDNMIRENKRKIESMDE